MIDRTGKVEVQILQKIKDGNEVCGDSYFYRETDEFFFSALADGLGSGRVALESSETVTRMAEKHIDEPLDVILQKCNEAFIGSRKRGSVVGLLRIDFQKQTYSFANIGNISMITFSNGDVKRNIPSQGYLPTSRKKFSIHENSLKNNSTLLMFSDGINASQLKQTFQQSCSVTDTINALKQNENNDDATLIAITFKNEEG